MGLAAGGCAGAASVAPSARSKHGRHMLVQIPLLVVAGALLASWVPAALRRELDAFNANGFPGILAAGFVSSYWMLPRALEGALSDPLMELAKFCSLPLLVGLPLALSWPRLGPIARGFVLANAISMIAVGRLAVS